MESNEDDRPRVLIITTSSFEGTVSVAILQELIDDRLPVQVEYSDELELNNVNLFQDKEIIICLGLPYRGYQLSHQFYNEVDLPFIEFIHICSFGEEIQGQHILSIVEPEVAGVKKVWELLTTERENNSIISKHLKETKKAMDMMDAVQAYKQWTHEKNNTVKLLLALWHMSYTRLPHIIRGKELTHLVKEYAPLIKGQFEKMDDYISKKGKTAKTFNVEIDNTPCILKVAYADQYINELANHLLHVDEHNLPVIVCLGRPTRGSDIYSVRTKGIPADRVAYVINYGQGKERVATLFLDVGYAELIGNSIVAKLSGGYD